MIPALLLTASLLGQPSVVVENPDSVEAGSAFTVSLTSNDPSCTSLSTQPVFSDGLAFLSSRSMRSTRSVNGVTESMCRLELMFQTYQGFEGPQTIGPMIVILGGGGVFRMPAESILVMPAGGMQQAGGMHSGKPLAIETVVEDERIYPGVPFDVDYYLLSRIMVKSVETGWGPPENGTASLVSSPETLVWRVMGDGSRRSRLNTLEVVAASDGEVRLPVMSANVWEAGEMFLGDGPLHTVSGDTIRMDVTPFPADGMPSGFTGVADSIGLRLIDTSRSGCDRLLLLEATGPGTRSMRSMPLPRVEGPATVTPTGDPSVSGDTLRQRFLLVQTDTGTVTAGGDSLPWFDTGSLEYRFATIPACSVHVDYMPPECDAAVSAGMDRPGGGSGPVVILIAVASCIVVLSLVLLLRSRRRSDPTSGIEDAGDVEELLSAFERGIAAVLSSRKPFLARDEAMELLDERGAPLMLQRRVQRLWKDLEQALAVGETGTAALDRLRAECSEVLAEAGRERKS